MSQLIEALLDPTLTFGEAEKEAIARSQLPDSRKRPEKSQSKKSEPADAQKEQAGEESQPVG